MKRPSFETLDIADLEEVTDESGARRMPAPPRGLWSDAPPPPPPPASAAASALDLGDLATHEAPPSERLDFDDLVEGLSWRPAPKPASGNWDLSVPALPPPPPLPAMSPASPPPRRRMRLALAVAGVALAAYALGVGTIWLLEPAEVAAPAVGDEPLAIAPVVIESEELLEAAPEPNEPSTPAPVLEARVLDAPRDEVAASRARWIAPPARAVERAAERAAVERPAVEEAALEEAAVEEAAVEEAAVGQPVHEAAADPAASDLPESPAREDVLSAMASAQPAIEACASQADRGQLARVRFSFASDGRTAHTIVQGVSGSTASCIATAARRVRVPAFSRDRFVIEFPFQL